MKRSYTHHYQYLDPEGNHTQNSVSLSDNDSEVLIKSLKTMILSRHIDQKCIALQRTGRLGTFPASTGQEAIFSMAGHTLCDTDVYVPYYRDQAALLARGMPIDNILDYWGGDERGNIFSHKQMDMPYCIPIASQCAHATGIAWSAKYHETNSVVMVTLGDGATSKGDFYESINFSGIHKLPIVFLINNNQWAISVPIDKQSGCKALVDKAVGAGIPSYQIDGNDAIALQKCLNHSIDLARNNQPCLIEAITYRTCDHTTSDDAKRYISVKNLEHAKESDPIKRLSHFLTQHGHWEKQQANRWDEQCKTQIENAVDRYLNRAPQSPASISNFHYENSTKIRKEHHHDTYCTSD